MECGTEEASSRPLANLAESVLSLRSGANEASCIAAYCRILGAVTAQRIENAVRFFPNLTRGERLCDVFEAYRTLFPKSELNFEQTVLIAVGLAQGDVIELGRCLGCPRTILIDRLAAGTRFVPLSVERCTGRVRRIIWYAIRKARDPEREIRKRATVVAAASPRVQAAALCTTASRSEPSPHMPAITACNLSKNTVPAKSGNAVAQSL